MYIYNRYSLYRTGDKTVKNITYKKILVPTDFSENSKPAIRLAISFAKKFNSQVHFLNVRPPELFPFYSALQAGDQNEREQDEKRGVLEQKEELKKFIKRYNLTGLRTKFIVKSGPPYKEIILTAREVGAGLIVLGAHGKAGASGIMLGSVAEKVVRQAPCPVLTVKPKEIKS